MPIVECVPNFSAGRDDTVIGAIAQAISSVASVYLLDVDKGWGANRTVITFAGEPDVVAEAAFQSIKTAARLIDMRNHSGAHPRLGATDVCPFVPLQGVDLAFCATLAQGLGSRVAAELDIPVFLYGEAARSPERKLLHEVRRGEYEGLVSRFAQLGSQPDFGKAVFNPSAGATIIGARPILIAYNVNLNTKSKKIASQIAARVRQSGRILKDLAGEPIVDRDGSLLRQPGTLKACRAVGWYVEEHDCAQVSTNLIDFHTTSLHDAYEEISRQAQALGAEVTGSELVGLTPLDAIVRAGRFYSQMKQPGAGSEPELLEIAIAALGLRSVRSFVAEDKIIEYRLLRYGVKLCL
jgi:glutamate formiminotransferase/formiminotetrahydrofolate cyclodeaminase